MTTKTESKMGRLVCQSLTGADNHTWDIGRILWALAFLIAIGLTAHGHIIGRPFDIQAFGLGISSILAAGGIALRLKESTEPQPPHKEKEDTSK